MIYMNQDQDSDNNRAPDAIIAGRLAVFVLYVALVLTAYSYVAFIVWNLLK